MDKNFQKELGGFEEIWRRVTEQKARPGHDPTDPLPAMMPRKRQKPKRRFDPK